MAHIAAHLNAEIIPVVTLSVALETNSLTSPPTSGEFGLRLDHESGTGPALK